MELKDYTTEQLIQEIRKRNAQCHARQLGKRCGECRHWGKIDYWGRADPDHRLYSSSCIFHQDSDGYYKCHSAYDAACEFYEPKTKISTTIKTKTWQTKNFTS